MSDTIPQLPLNIDQATKSDSREDAAPPWHCPNTTNLPREDEHPQHETTEERTTKFSCQKAPRRPYGFHQYLAQSSMTGQTRHALLAISVLGTNNLTRTRAHAATAGLHSVIALAIVH